MRNANGEIFNTDSYVRNEKEREFLVPARTRIGLKLLTRHHPFHRPFPYGLVDGVFQDWIKACDVGALSSSSSC